jgi:hypothetical protein
MRVEQVVFSMGVAEPLRSVVLLLMLLTFLMLFRWPVRLVQTGAMGGAMSGGVRAGRGRFPDNRGSARTGREHYSVIQVWITIV